MCLRLQKISQQIRKSEEGSKSSDFLAYPPSKTSEVRVLNLWNSPQGNKNAVQSTLTLNWLVGAFLLAVATAICGITAAGRDVAFIAQSLSVGFALIFAAILFYGMMVFHPFQPPERRRYVTLAKEELK